VDGSLEATNTDYSGRLPSKDGDVWMGKHYNSLVSTDYFDGTIDEVLVFNRSLSAQEVLTLYLNGTQTIAYDETTKGEYWHCEVTPNDGSADGISKNSTWIFIENDGPRQDTPYIGAHNNLNDGLVGEWRFEWGNSTWTYDEVEKNNLTVTGAAETDEGRVGKAYEFDGVNDRIYKGTGVANLNETATITAWIRAPVQTASYAGIVSSGASSPRGGFEFALRNNGQLALWVGGDTWDAWTPSISLDDNEWHFVAAVLDNTQLTMYADDENSGQISSGYLNLDDSASFRTCIGCRVYSGYSEFFNGSIDEVTIWNRSLSVAEIQHLYNSTKGNYAHQNQDLSCSPDNQIDPDSDDFKNIYNWYVNGTSITLLNMPFDTNGSTVKDYSGYNNDGTITGDPIWNETAGYDNKGAYIFDGTDDSISVPIQSNINLSQGFALSSWVKPYDLVNYQMWISHYTTQHPVEIYTFANVIRLFCGNNSAVQSSSTLTANTWYHVVGNFDGENCSVWIDGELSNSAVRPYVANDITWTIGRRVGGSLWNGTIDQVLIFNRSLNADQIKSLYRTGFQTIARNETALGEYWKCEITPTDGYDDGKSYNTTEIPIINSEPTTPELRSPENNSRQIGNLVSLNWSASTDIDGDLITYYVYHSDSETPTYLGSTTDTNFTTATTDGTTYYWYVIAGDGTANSSASETWQYRENAKPPQVNLSYPQNNNHTGVRSPTFNWTDVIDQDGDTVNYTLDITTYCTSSECDSLDNIYVTNITTNEYTILQILKNLWEQGDYEDYYNWTVRAWDGYEYSDLSDEFRVYIDALVVLNVINDTVDFGELTNGEKVNTTQASYDPLGIQNDGNCFLDVNLSATALWSSVALPSSYYQYKVDEYPGEANSFNVSGSTITWTNVPEANETFLAFFNYTNATDTAEVDIAIEVQSEETAGNKSSTIIFTGWLVHE
jgi:hypothetical protein